MNLELDYNDQCDLAYGRISRLAQQKPEILESQDIGVVAESVKGLGLSGDQVETVFIYLKAQRSERSSLREAVEVAWGVIANAKGWDEGSSEWKSAAEDWRDRHYTSLRMDSAEFSG